MGLLKKLRKEVSIPATVETRGSGVGTLRRGGNKVEVRGRGEALKSDSGVYRAGQEKSRERTENVRWRREV